MQMGPAKELARHKTAESHAQALDKLLDTEEITDCS